MGDWPLYMLSVAHGPIGYIPEVMAVYRRHAGGYWSRLGEVERYTQLIAFLREMNARLDGRFAAAAQAGIAEFQMRLYSAYRTEGRPWRAWRVLTSSVFENFLSEHLTKRQLVRMVLRAVRRPIPSASPSSLPRRP